MKFTDSIDENLETISQLLGNCTPGQKEHAKRAAMQIEGTVEAIRKDARGDPVAGLGLVFAIFYIAQNLVRDGSVREDGPRIQLLS